MVRSHKGLEGFAIFALKYDFWERLCDFLCRRSFVIFCKPLAFNFLYTLLKIAVTPLIRSMQIGASYMRQMLYAYAAQSARENVIFFSDF